MPNTDSWSSRFKDEVFSLSSVMILTAAVFALVAAYVMMWLTADSGAAAGALMSIGIGVQWLYDEWPARYTSAISICLWTGAESVFAFCVYVLVFTLVATGYSTIIATTLAILVTTSLPIDVQLYRTWTNS